MEIQPPDGLAGEVLLRDRDGNPLRLPWPAGKEPARFPLAAGAYKWVHYRLVDGAWHVSATGLGDIDVKADRPTTLELTRKVRLGVGAPRRQDMIQVSANLQGERHSGLSIYHEGRRVALRWAFLDAAAAETASGSLRYG